MVPSIKSVDKVEILTLQDNYIDLVAQDNSEVIQRAMPLKGLEVRNSILAEHGFSAFITSTSNGTVRSVLFDFGFSEHGAAVNADALNTDLTSVEALVLSHGHLDHVGGLAELVARVGRKPLDLILHPEAFRNPRHLKITDDFKIVFPAFTRDKAEQAGTSVVATDRPYFFLDGQAVFLGGIPRKTEFEKGAPNFVYGEGDDETHDQIDDDSALVYHVRGRGLVVVTGCGHAGVVNTINYAKDVTGADTLLAVVGGFHLSGADFETVVKPTVDSIKALAPRYIVPTHCTGRAAIQFIEKEMPEQFLLNMAGTRLTFAA